MERPTTGDERWLTWALEITETQASLFWDARDGGWFSTTGEPGCSRVGGSCSVRTFRVNVRSNRPPRPNSASRSTSDVSVLPSPSGGIQVARQRFSSLSPTTPILTDAEVGLGRSVDNRIVVDDNAASRYHA